MNILAAIKREERKLEKQLGKLQKQLDGVRAAGKALGNSANRELTGIRKRVLCLKLVERRLRKQPKSGGQRLEHKRKRQ